MQSSVEIRGCKIWGRAIVSVLVPQSIDEVINLYVG